ncbi:MAG: NAD(P)H-hydrate dehydratase [Gallionellaceae bacterium]|nr:MAG: NAD(P)H-hydrate dehydratase [Gallionellaceae bacterium]
MSPTRIPAITRKQVAAYLKPRPQDSHKGLFGTVSVIGGDTGMVGAALLAGRAALKLGAGCVHVGLLADNAPALDNLMPELMLDSAGATLKKLPHPALSRGERVLPPSPSGRGIEGEGNVLVLGCGLGHSLAAQKLVYDALLLDVPTVLDADALNIIAMRPDLRAMLHTRKAPAVCTPHPGEAARLLGRKTEDIQADRAAAALALAKKLNGSVVLKGAGSICATRDGKLHLNRTGNPGMSSAGMGDVLAGMIAAFIAQGLSADEALLLAVHLHGAAGDALAQQQATIGMSGTEVTEWARWLLNQWIAK